MAKTKTIKPDNIEQSIVKASDDVPRFRLGEIGVSGVPIFNGISQQELKKELNHPNSIKTYKLMSYHPTVSAALNLYSSMAAKGRFRFKAPSEATNKELKQTKIIESMFHDMEHSLEDFIEEVMTFTQYGWATTEKVFRRRLYSAGSAYNDGLIGIRKLPLRAQESVKKFSFDDSGNTVTALHQDLGNIYDPYNQFKKRKDSEIVIPRSKFLLFTLGRDRSNPYGKSPLRDVYTAWKYLQAIEELEAQSIVKDVNGLPVLSLPAQYLSADATVEQKAILASFQNIMRNLQQGSQSSVILPSSYDPDTRQPMFKLELLTQDGKKNFDLNKIKDYYRTLIFVGLGTDILLLGNTTAGSFALGSIKNSLANNYVETFIKRITQVVNEDLIKQLYQLNGWDISRRCTFDYEGMDDVDLEGLSKYFQRVASVGLMPKTLDVINRVMDTIGLDPLPEDTTQEELDSLLTPNTSGASEGMVTAGAGTSTDGNNISSGDSNLENVG